MDLNHELNQLKEKLIASGFVNKEDLEEEKSVFPFSHEEFLFSYLLHYEIISFEKYLSIREQYYQENKYLHLFEMAPRSFGETWGQKHLIDIEPSFSIPTKNIDPSFDGEYDLIYNNIKIEVKASRAVEKKAGGSLTSKALRANDDKKFDMNFQQLKPKLCDVYIWLGVWRDEIKYWVLSSNEVINNKYYSPGQHRGNEGEGQLWIKHSNVEEFNDYLVYENELLEKVVEKASIG